MFFKKSSDFIKPKIVERKLYLRFIVGCILKNRQMLQKLILLSLVCG